MARKQRQAFRADTGINYDVDGVGEFHIARESRSKCAAGYRYVVFDRWGQVDRFTAKNLEEAKRIVIKNRLKYMGRM